MFSKIDKSIIEYDEELIHVTTSFGGVFVPYESVKAFSTTDEDIETLSRITMKIADEQLYKSKKEGRNKMNIATLSLKNINY